MDITTERLHIRPVEAGDWRDLQAIWETQRRSPLAQYDKPKDTSSEAVLARIAKWTSFAGSRDHIFLAVCREGRMIGYIALNRRTDSMEVGYCFHSAWHGKGYARESLAAVLREAGAQGVAQRFTAGAALDNLPSSRLLAAVGFRLTGTEQVSFYQDEAGRPIWFEGGLYEMTLPCK